MQVTYSRRTRGDRGASAVEFALVVPILLTIVFGIINFGFVFAQQLSLSNGARQAARFAVVSGQDCSEIRTEGKNSGATIGMSAAQIPNPVIEKATVPSVPPATPVAPSWSGACTTAEPCIGTPPVGSSTNIRVTMTRTSTWVVTFPPFNFIPSPTLTGTGVMRCEFS